MYRSVPASLISGLLLNLTALGAAQAESIEQRLERVENLLGNQVLIEQTQQMQQIRQELAEIREMVEGQEHELSMIKQRQRNLYQDMDRRLHNLEVGTGAVRSSSSAPAPVPPPQSASVPSSNVAPPGASDTRDTKPAVAADPADKDGKLAYSQAFKMLKDGQYQQAILAFRNFIKSFPESRYAANAQYWLGEANYVSRDYKSALQEFQKILANFPDSNKVQGAELKIGYTYYEMNDWAAARTALKQVIEHHPNTTVAKKAEERLQRMEREGR